MSGPVQKKGKWLTIAAAVELLPVEVTASTVRRWIEEGKYGIVGGKFGGRLVVRSDSLPGVKSDMTDNELSA